MSLSVCCLTADPGPQVAALLGLLRPLAAEVIVGADARVSDDDLAHYAAAADRVRRVQFNGAIERHLGWLHAQCSGEWILRIDGDEVPSQGLLEALPALIADRCAEQYWIPRRWLFPDAAHYLDESPWWPDYQCRLVRNDGLLRFPGHLHSSAARTAPTGYLEVPLYHAACLLADVEQRRLKALRYEVMEPSQTARSGVPLSHCYLLPERYSRRPGRRTPAEDAPLIAAVMAPSPRPAAPFADCEPVVPGSSTDVHWSGREVPEDAYHADVAAIESDHRMYAGEHRALHFRFVNRGSERWHWDPDLSPQIRASYRWRELDGTISDGPRTPFPGLVRPGESVVVPVVVSAPAQTGSLTLEVDAVHEGVRWFGRPARIRLEIVPRPRPIEVRPRRPAQGAGRPGARAAQGQGRSRIPRVMHWIWLGEEPRPDDFRRCEETWRRHHPEWDFRLWTDRDLGELVAAADRARARGPIELSHLVRYEVLHRFGGVYLDVDLECRRPLDPLLAGVDAFAACVVAGRLGTGVLGSAPGHAAFADAARCARHTLGAPASASDDTGAYLLTLVMAEHPDVTVFEPELFYPYTWEEPARRDGGFPDAYAVHNWASRTP